MLILAIIAPAKVLTYFSDLKSLPNFFFFVSVFLTNRFRFHDTVVSAAKCHFARKVEEFFLVEFEREATLCKLIDSTDAFDRVNQLISIQQLKHECWDNPH